MFRLVGGEAVYRLILAVMLTAHCAGRRGKAEQDVEGAVARSHGHHDYLDLDDRQADREPDIATTPRTSPIN